MNSNPTECWQLESCDIGQIEHLRRGYADRLAVPLDGMWEAFVGMGTAHRIIQQGREIGYAVIGFEGQLLQWTAEQGPHMSLDPQAVMRVCLDQLKPASAMAATAQPEYLAACLDHQASVRVHTIMYRRELALGIPGEVNLMGGDITDWTALQPPQLETAVDFASRTLGADRDWLTGYYQNLIGRSELFGLWSQQQLVACGEKRAHPWHAKVRDLGVVVAPEYRGRGLATAILKQLVGDCHREQLLPICSTEVGNLAAQTAIRNAGLVARDRLMEIQFRTAEAED